MLNSFGAQKGFPSPTQMGAAQEQASPVFASSAVRLKATRACLEGWATLKHSEDQNWINRWVAIDVSTLILWARMFLIPVHIV